MTAYDEPMFLSALNNNQLPSEFAQRVQSFLAASFPPSQALLFTFRSFVTEMDSVIAQSGNGAPRVMQILQMFSQVFPWAFHIEQLDWLAPQPGKTFSPPPPPNPVDAEDLHGEDAFCLETTALKPAPDDNNTNAPIRWDSINTVAWKTTYNASCVGQAVGPCSVKLGILPANMTCKDWNDLSKAVGTKAGGSGAVQSGISAYYNSKGYSCTRAWSGPFESAVQEAKKALDRGCDVEISYRSSDGKQGHREMVTAIAVDANNSSKATVTTLSWGQQATVTVESGSYSGKSDGNRYRAPGQNKSYLEGTGTAYLYYYCKK